jgi:hypothetical protein
MCHYVPDGICHVPRVAPRNFFGTEGKLAFLQLAAQSFWGLGFSRIVEGGLKMRVLARAYRDQPLDRMVVGENARVYYIANPSTVSSTGKCTSGGVGFPKAYVFEFDSVLFDSLERAWLARDSEALATLWQEASPYHGDDKLAA